MTRIILFILFLAQIGSITTHAQPKTYCIKYAVNVEGLGEEVRKGIDLSENFITYYSELGVFRYIPGSQSFCFNNHKDKTVIYDSGGRLLKRKGSPNNSKFTSYISRTDSLCEIGTTTGNYTFTFSPDSLKVDTDLLSNYGEHCLNLITQEYGLLPTSLKWGNIIIKVEEVINLTKAEIAALDKAIQKPTKKNIRLGTQVLADKMTTSGS